MSEELLPGDSLKACIQSERQLIGCLLHRPDFIHEVTGIVSGESFFDVSFAVLFDVIATTVSNGLQIDSYTIAQKVLGKTGNGEIETILRSVSELKHEVANAANVVYYAKQVAGWNAMREVRKASINLINKTNACTEAPECLPLLSEAAKVIEAANVVREDDVLDASQLAGFALDDIDRAMDSQSSSGIETGLEAIDLRWGGLYDGELVILAARPSIGKTALALSIACSMAESGKSVFFASLEMTKQQVGLRLLSRMTGIPCDRLRIGYSLSIPERTRLGEAKAKLKQWPMRVWCSSGVTVHEIASRARLHATRMGLDAVFIDYLGQGKIKPIRKHSNANDSITEIVGDVANFTKQINKPVVCLCQLNRGAEGEEPGLQNLRDSGSIEQDADAVWFLHRKRDDSQTKLLVRKCRNGEIGEAELVFNGDKATFYDAAPKFVSEYAGDFR